MLRSERRSEFPKLQSGQIAQHPLERASPRSIAGVPRVPVRDDPSFMGATGRAWKEMRRVPRGHTSPR